MISIIIPTLNAEKFLRPCLDSIFNQSYKDFEVIVVDGYSKDKTYDILKEYRQRFYRRLHMVFVRPQGQSDAINKGMDMAVGDIVTYICADDTYEPDCFSVVQSVFESQHKTNWLYGKAKIIDLNGSETRNIVTKAKELLQPRYSYHALKCVDFIVQPAVFMRAGFYQKIGKFDTNLKYVMDYDYWLRAGKAYTPMFVNYYLANWRAHSESLSVRQYSEEAKQAFEVQKKYSSWIFKPFQWLVYMGTKIIYKVL